MKTIRTLDEATGKALDLYKELKKSRKDKKTNLMEQAIDSVYESWAKHNGYEKDVFRAAAFTKINTWKQKKKSVISSTAPTPPTTLHKKAKQLGLFAEDTVEKIVKSVKRKAGYGALTWANH